MARNVRFRTDDPEAFSKALMKEADVMFPRFCKEVQVGIVARAYDGIVRGTPVLTGRARKNWFVTLRAPSTRVIDGNQQVAEPGHWFSVTGEPLSVEERGVLETISAQLRAAPLGRKVYISNNLAYIADLEDGTSAKAPAGMVAITVDWVTGAGQTAQIARAAHQML